MFLLLPPGLPSQNHSLSSSKVFGPQVSKNRLQVLFPMKGCSTCVGKGRFAGLYGSLAGGNIKQVGLLYGGSRLQAKVSELSPSSLHIYNLFLWIGKKDWLFCRLLIIFFCQEVIISVPEVKVPRVLFKSLHYPKTNWRCSSIGWLLSFCITKKPLFCTSRPSFGSWGRLFLVAISLSCRVFCNRQPFFS